MALGGVETQAPTAHERLLAASFPTLVWPEPPLLTERQKSLKADINQYLDPLNRITEKP